MYQMKKFRLLSVSILILTLLFSCFGNKKTAGPVISDDPSVIGESDGAMDDAGVINGYDAPNDAGVIDESSVVDESGLMGVFDGVQTDDTESMDNEDEIGSFDSES